jgi:hypothetical protein
MFEALGITELIEEAREVDSSGSTVLEYLFSRQGNNLPGFEFGIKETIAAASSYFALDLKTPRT